YIWGRGALDCKSSLLAQLEAVEYLVKNGFKPGRAIYLGYGCDEEPQGSKGAVKIAEYLRTQGEQFEYIHDEGDLIVSGSVPGVSKPVALIAIAEPGVVYMELSAEAEGGHAGAPPRQTAVAVVAAAITKLGQKPFPCHGTAKIFSYVGPEMTMPYKMIFANTWLFGPIIKAKLAAQTTTDATQRTVVTPTVFQGSAERATMLPTHASAVVRFGIIPGENIDFVMQRVKTVINDPRVKVELYSGFVNQNPSPVSRTDTWAFQTFNKSIREIFPDVIVAPHVSIGRQDCYRYNDLSSNILRFAPQRISGKELILFHGYNERISINNFGEMIDFYIQLMKNSAG
ncbi:MAG: M20/M25/M40 family metallo-hydrolase, partial [Dehalococcoidia bacterium]|nr:M20/M25/M40 family metallo-hydrolase [Dehalococcoidia bacterium]